jgi:hypothetical protein
MIVGDMYALPSAGHAQAGQRAAVQRRAYGECGGSFCALPGAAQAYVFNATVVPVVSVGYLTLWPDGEQQPVVSTLNAVDGAITSNMAIVPNLDGKIDAYANGLTQLLLDISSYFAP